MNNIKLLSALLTALFMLTLTACSGEADNDGPSVSTDTGSNNDASGDATPDEDSLCGEFAPCGTNSDCSANQYCDNGCCADIVDPGTGEDPCFVDTDGDGEPDHNVTYEGECDGSISIWCDDSGFTNVLNVYDCADWGETCDWMETAGWFDCVAYEDSVCLFSDGFGNIETISYCQGNDPACMFDLDEWADLAETMGTCTSDVGSCTDTDIGACDGDLLYWWCNFEQPTLLDCGASGGTCEATGDGMCVGLEEGAICVTGFLECADGFTCEGESDTTWGTCTGAESYDLEVNGSDFEDYDGYTVWGALVNNDTDDVLDRSDEEIDEDGEFEFEFEGLIFEGGNYRVDLLIVIDEEEDCEDGDNLGWEIEVDDVDGDTDVDVEFDEDDDNDADVCESFGDFTLEVECDDFDDYEDMIAYMALLDEDGELVTDDDDDVSGSGSFDFSVDVEWSESYSLHFFIDVDDADGDCDADNDLVWQEDVGPVMQGMELEFDFDDLEAGDDCGFFAGEETGGEDAGTGGDTTTPDAGTGGDASLDAGMDMDADQ
jgi:hypothetical protein